jgi:5-methylcytosine-specific restriction endonuclease McrA
MNEIFSFIMFLGLISFLFILSKVGSPAISPDANSPASCRECASSRISSSKFLGRQPIPQWLRRSVMFRDNSTCKMCGLRGGPGGDPNVYLEIDHVIPVSAGGCNHEGNLQILCRRCNLKKGSRGNNSRRF